MTAIRHPSGLGAALAAALLLAAAAPAAAQTDPPPIPLGPVPVPPENPMTLEKAVLGKILFWDEQLSSDNSIACGTCHITNGFDGGGSDPRAGTLGNRHPGADGMFGTGDEVDASAGVLAADGNDDLFPHPFFLFEPQVTHRTAQTVFMSAYDPDLFWDGRAETTFVDPEGTGEEIVIPTGGGLESQAVGPPLSDVEMAKMDHTWAEITAKLANVAPLGLGSAFPPDVQAALDDPSTDTYPELFASAFPSDPVISARNIAMAIATYERMLIPDQTPYDLWAAGDEDALTDAQKRGWEVFNDPAITNCASCHTPPNFSDGDFHNVGLRDPDEDLGRQEHTGLEEDRGKFKTPSLRGANERTRLFHTGDFTTFVQTTAFYIQGGIVNDNLDPLIVPLPNLIRDDRVDLIDFLQNALTDPRTVNGEFPFDRPLLFDEWFPNNPANVGGGVAGTDGITPRLVVTTPPALGTTAFRIGLVDGLGGSNGVIRFGVPGAIPVTSIPITLGGQPGVGGSGFATIHIDLPTDQGLAGSTLRIQGFVMDAGSATGRAATDRLDFTLF